MSRSGKSNARKRRLENAVLSGAIVCAVTAATVAATGMRASGSAIAPINAISHVLYGPRAAGVHRVDARHTALALAINFGASVLWAAVYEKAFGRAAERGDFARAFAGGAGVAALAYVTDYQLVPRRLTPGWEYRLPRRSLTLVYAAMAFCLPLRGLLDAVFRARR